MPTKTNRTRRWVESGRAERDGNGTSQLRTALELVKDKPNKSETKPETHSVDSIALTCGFFIQDRPVQQGRHHGYTWLGQVNTRPAAAKQGQEYAVFRRRLHFEVPAKSSIRRYNGGTVTPWGFRVGDLAQATKGKSKTMGYHGDYNEANQVVSLYEWQWKRIG
jgi:hypothetical protein